MQGYFIWFSADQHVTNLIKVITAQIGLLNLKKYHYQHFITHYQIGVTHSDMNTKPLAHNAGQSTSLNVNVTSFFPFNFLLFFIDVSVPSEKATPKQDSSVHATIFY